MRKLAIFTGSFSLGIFLSQYLLSAVWLLPCAVGAFLFSCGRLVVPGDWGRRLLLAGVDISLAFGWNWLYMRQVQRPMEALADTEHVLTMTLCDYAVPTDYGAKATVRAEGLPGKLAYYGGAELLELRPGQSVRALVRLGSAARIRDDDITTFTSKGVFLLAYQRETLEIGEEAAPFGWPVRLGHAMQEKIGELYRGDTAGFLTAILTGDKAGLSEQASWNLSEAGLFHILAVSGMHCSFLLTLVRLLTGRHRRRLLAGVTVVLLVFYALLTGGSPSVVRACVMLIFLLAAPLLGRESDGPTSLLSALFFILLENPFAAASISLQLSFGAVAGILWLTPKLHRLLLGDRKHGKYFRFLAAGCSTTLGALVFTVPLSAYYFGTLVLISPVSNLLCLWAASLVFILGLVSVLLGFLCTPLGMLVGIVPALLTRYILAAARLLESIPYHAVYFANPYLKYWLAFLYLLFTAAYLLGPKGRRKYVLAACCGALTLTVTVWLGAERFQSDLDAVVLDVGQGQSVLLSSQSSFALVDCGSGNSWYDAGQTAVHQLRSLGCWRLDYLILTHFDSDHINGAVSVLQHVSVGTLLVPEPTDITDAYLAVTEAAKERGTKIRTLETMANIPLGAAICTVYPPTGGVEDNERGLAILISVGEEDLLITGDMNAAAERRLLTAYELPDLEYLVAGHHGSKFSTTDDLLDALDPETALISVGSNSYGHPAEETLRRLAEHGCTVYRTDLHGDIHLSIQQGDEHEKEQ